MRLKTIRINLLVLFAMLLFVEVTGQLIFYIKWDWFRLKGRDRNYTDKVFRRHPYLSVALNKNVNEAYPPDTSLRVRSTGIATRGTGANLEDTSKIRIACLGGSTTFCIFINEELSWPYLLQKELGDRYAVINYGFPGYTTVESIVQMALIVPEMKPQMVIFYHGWNDLHNYYQPGSYPDYHWHGSNQVKSVFNTFDNEPFIETIKRISGTWYIIENLLELMNYKPPSPVLYKASDTVIDSLYARNLRTLKTLATSQNSLPVFIPQIMNPEFERKENTSQRWSMHIDNSVFDSLMNRLGIIMHEQVQGNDSTVYFYDGIRTTLKWKNSDFIDDGHFSAEGNRKFASMLAKKIKTIGMQ